MTLRSQHKAMAAFGVLGVSLMLSSTAFACTTYVGQLTASGNGTGNAGQTWVGNGTGMSWCSIPTPTVKVASGSSTISLDTLPVTRTKSCAGGQLTAGTSYDVGVTAPGVGYMPSGGGTGAVHNCHIATGVTVVATGSVNSGGVFTNSATGTSTVNYTTPSGIGANSICIFDNSGATADAIAANMNTV